MTLDQFVQDLSWIIYLIIFVVVAIHAVRRPLRANIDIALLFGAAAVSIALSVATSTGLIARGPLITGLSGSLLVGMVYMLFRIVDDFSDVRPWLMRASDVAFALTVAGAFYFAFFPPQPLWFSTLALVYLLAALFYSVAAFARETSRSSGVTRRRLLAVMAGSASLFAIFILVA